MVLILWEKPIETIPIKIELSLFQPRMKMSVITDISVFRFYGYIRYIGDIFGYIGDISVDILT